MRNLAIISAGVLLAAFAPAQVHVIPDGTAAVEANSSSSYPWNRRSSDIRVQYIYDSTHFTNAGINSPIIIDQLRWRPSGTATTWTGGTYGSATIHVNDAGVDHTSAGTTFAANHAGGLEPATPAYQGAVAVIPGTGNGIGVPAPYYVDVTLQNSYLYDPTTGIDLIIDVALDGTQWSGNGGTETVALDVSAGPAAAPPPNASRVYNIAVGGHLAPTGLVQADIGAVVEVNYSPAVGLHPNFTADVTAGLTPLTVSFTDATFTSDPGGITSWAWDVDDDGTTDYTTQNCQHVYATCGNFTVSLTVTDAMHGSQTMTKTDLIGADRVEADFTATPTGGFAPLTVSFTDASTGTPTAWAWDFDSDGTIDDTRRNPTAILAAGTYDVSLTVTRNCQSDTELKTGFVVSVTAPNSPNSILTTLASGNGLSTDAGCFFDITCAQDLVIQGISIHTDDLGACGASVYMTSGTYVGKETSPDSWALVSQGSGVAMGLGMESYVDLEDFFLLAGTYGIAVFNDGVNINYTDGNGTNQIYSDPFITLNLGASQSDRLVSSPISPRVWNGAIYYDPSPSLTGFGFLGEGCPGSTGTVDVHRAPGTLPNLGQTVTINVTNMPVTSPLAVMVIGANARTDDLTSVGLPGCIGRTSIANSFFIPNNNGSGFFDFIVPPFGHLLGQRFFTQVIVVDSGAIYPLGASVSHASAARIN